MHSTFCRPGISVSITIDDERLKELYAWMNCWYREEFELHGRLSTSDRFRLISIRLTCRNLNDFLRHGWLCVVGKVLLA